MLDVDSVYTNKERCKCGGKNGVLGLGPGLKGGEGVAGCPG